MSNATSAAVRVPPPRRIQRSIYQVHYALPKPKEEMARPCDLYRQDATDIKECGYQVAGHMSTADKKFIGLLQCNNGTVLKPIIKEAQKREVDFYKEVTTSQHPDLVELRKLVPKYYGCRKFTYNGVEREYIILEDLVKDMLEPCIMDVKIGKRTWGPDATPEKIERESSKYAACKQQYGFCIPGMQIYRTEGAPPIRYGKDFGKRLKGKCVKDAMRRFLSPCGGAAGVCRAALLRLLGALWRAQRWAHTQRRLQLSAASLLLLYDAHEARPHCTLPASGTNITRRMSTACIEGNVSAVPYTPPSRGRHWADALEKLSTSHSFEHNYEEKLTEIKCNYRSTLERLTSDAPPTSAWASVHIIDFAHAHFNDEQEECLDENFIEGVDNLVDMFEEFLREIDGQDN